MSSLLDLCLGLLLRVREGRGWKGMGANVSRAFSNLVADNQYSVLGLMLLGTLARVKSILGRLMGDEDHEVTVDVKATEEKASEALQQQDDPGDDDFGEVVRREDILADVEGSRDDLHEGEDEVDEDGRPGEQGEEKTTEEIEKSTMARPWKKKRIGPWIGRDEGLAEESTSSKPPKKKRKKGDAFDALFDSLI